ncbi:hypothetical protein VDIAB_120088 [Vibrio diabolicus]|nr:hypothetical protein VDIAB_120088 [Vibrio diabolicus]
MKSLMPLIASKETKSRLASQISQAETLEESLKKVIDTKL